MAPQLIPTLSTSATDSVEIFARLCARLDHPFADRPRVLAEAGLGEARHAQLLEGWAARMSGEDGEELRREFGEIYVAARHGIEPEQASRRDSTPAQVPAGVESVELHDTDEVPAAPAPPLEVPSFMQERPPAMEPAAPGAAAGVSTETGSLDLWQLLKAPLPFDPNASPAPSSALRGAPSSPSVSTGTAEIDVSKLLECSRPSGDSRSSAPAQGPAASPAGAVSTETTELDLRALFGRAVPFSPAEGVPETAELPMLAAPAPRGRGRWIRFNPQTGESLAAPYWEELPSTDKKVPT